MHVLTITDTPWHEGENESSALQEEDRSGGLPRLSGEETCLPSSGGPIRLITVRRGRFLPFHNHRSLARQLASE